jgi:hypothetical protein
MRFDQLRAQVSEHIEKHGWSITGVFGDSLRDQFSYSTGASLLGKPELIITGLNPESCAHFINALLTYDKLETDKPYEDLANMPMVLKRVTYSDFIKRNYMTITAQYFEGVPFEIFQIVYPDPKGLFPWDEGYSFEPQTLLYDGAPK